MWGWYRRSPSDLKASPKGWDDYGEKARRPTCYNYQVAIALITLQFNAVKMKIQEAGLQKSSWLLDLREYRASPVILACEDTMWRKRKLQSHLVSDTVRLLSIFNQRHVCELRYKIWKHLLRDQKRRSSFSPSGYMPCCRRLKELVERRVNVGIIFRMLAFETCARTVKMLL